MIFLIFAGLDLTSPVVMLLTEDNVNSATDIVLAKLNNGLLTPIPMFAFMAHIMIRAGVVKDLYDAANAMVGHLKGGLGVATILSCTTFCGDIRVFRCYDSHNRIYGHFADEVLQL